MGHRNIEIKARCNNASEIRNYLQKQNALFKGIDDQIDTYFEVMQGRLKLRQGNIENSLIFYNRENIAGPKMSEVILFPVENNSEILKQILISSFGIKVIVKKKREIYFIENVKFHIDEVEGLGNFVEIEAIDEHGVFDEQTIRSQCDYYLQQFGITDENLLTHSYSDLLLKAS